MKEVEYVIGIDLGTKCGWAVLKSDGTRVESGTWDLATQRHEGGGMRYVRFANELTAAHIYGGLMATLQSVLELDKHPYVSIPVGTIKKHATGKGNSGKELMISTAEARWQEEGWQLKDDNEADALWVASAYLAGLF